MLGESSAVVRTAVVRTAVAMALTMSATVHVDSRRATVHWHNEHDKAPEATRRLADTHEVAQDVLCHELRSLEVRYSKLEGLIQRLVGLVQRDCPATLMEFMERGAHQAHARHDGAPPERVGAEPQLMLPPVPAACWEALASKPQRGQSSVRTPQSAAHDGMTRHKGVGFGGPRVDRLGGVPFWDLCSGAVLEHAEGTAPQLGPEYTLACWVHWRPASHAADVRTLLCGEGGNEWLRATGDTLGSYAADDAAADGAADAPLGLGGQSGHAFEAFRGVNGDGVAAPPPPRGWQLVVLTGRDETATALAESRLYVGTPSRPPLLAGVSGRAWSGARLSRIGDPAAPPGWVAAVWAWQRRLTEAEMAALHEASRAPFASQHGAAAAMAARLSAAAARRERTAAEAAAKEGRRAAVEEVKQRNGACAAGVRAAREEAQRLAGLEAVRDAAAASIQKQHAKMAAARRLSEASEAAAEARTARWLEAARRRAEAERLQLAAAAQMAASLIQRRLRKRSAGAAAATRRAAAATATAVDAGPNARRALEEICRATKQRATQENAEHCAQQRAAAGRAAEAAKELAVRRQRTAHTARATRVSGLEAAADERRQRTMAAALRIQTRKHERDEAEQVRQEGALAARRQVANDTARHKRIVAAAQGANVARPSDLV